MTADAELCLRFGACGGIAHILFVAPLFEEANRTRRTIVLTMRALAAQGIASSLPDLPGQNDSLIPTDAVDLDQWRGALAAHVAAETDAVILASFRGGSLIDAIPGPVGWWRLAPLTGNSQLRTMLRTRVASDREAGVHSSIDTLLAEGAVNGLHLAGNRLSPSMLAQLQNAVPEDVAPLRSRNLGDAADSLPGTPLWLRAEPGEDAAMADAMAADLALWAKQCVQR